MSVTDDDFPESYRFQFALTSVVKFPEDATGERVSEDERNRRIALADQFDDRFGMLLQSTSGGTASVQRGTPTVNSIEYEALWSFVCFSLDVAFRFAEILTAETTIIQAANSSWRRVAPNATFVRSSVSHPQMPRGFENELRRRRNNELWKEMPDGSFTVGDSSNNGVDEETERKPKANPKLDVGRMAQLAAYLGIAIIFVGMNKCTADQHNAEIDRRFDEIDRSISELSKTGTTTATSSEGGSVSVVVPPPPNPPVARPDCPDCPVVLRIQPTRN